MPYWRKLLALGFVALVAACGGGGGGGTDSAATVSPPSETAGPAGPVPGGNKLFVAALSTRLSIAFFDTLVPAGPTIGLGEVLNLPFSNFDLGLAYDGRRDLLYSNFSDEVVLYEKASLMGSASEPSRRIPLPSGTHNTSALDLDAERDVLYVALGYQSRGQVLVYERASALAHGAAPSRAFTMLQFPASLAIDPGRRLAYWVGGSGGDVFAFSLDSAPGLVESGLKLRVGNVKIALDPARDRLYAAGAGKLRIFEAVSTAAPREVVSMPLVNADAVALDTANDRLYVGARDQAYIFEGASRLGSAASGPAVMVQGPTGVLIIGFAFAR